MLQCCFLERMAARAREIHNINFLFSDHVEDSPPDPPDKRKGKLLGREKQEVDVAAPCIVRADRGHARVGGVDVASDPHAVRAQLGMLSDARGLYAFMRGDAARAILGRYGLDAPVGD
jgi:hypothetical protein